MISYILGTNPVLQFTDNQGNFLTYGRVRTLDWATRQPKATYYDPAGLKPRPNPFPLDSVGRAFEVYFSDEGAYYLELINQQGIKIWSSQEPYIPAGGGGGNITVATEENNLFINGQMRFFPTSEYKPIPNGISANVAEGGWEFDKAGTNLNDGLEFLRFTADNTDVDASPTYYLRYFCNGVAVDETKKDLIYTFQDVRTLADNQISVSAWVRSAIEGDYPIEVYAVQNFGTSSTVSPSATVTTLLGIYTPTTAWANYSLTATIPSLSGKTIGTNNDDNLQIVFRMPLNSIADLELTNFYFKRGAQSNKYYYESYEEIDATLKAIELPRPNPITNFTNLSIPNTGDQAYDVITLEPVNRLLQQAWMPPVPVGTVLLWLSDKAPNGYIEAAGDQLIRAGQFERLFNVPFNSTVFGEAFGAVGTNTLTPNKFLTNTFTITNVDIGTIKATWLAGDTGFAYTRNSVNHGAEYSIAQISGTVWRYTAPENGNVGTVAFNNSACGLTILSNGSAGSPAEFEITAVPASSIVPGSDIAYSSPAGSYYIYFVKDGTGSDPAIPGRIGRACEIQTGYTAEDVGLCIARSIAGYESGTFTALPGSQIKPGSYFYVTSETRGFQVYYRVNGSTDLPVSIIDALVPVMINSTDTADEVADKTIAAFSPLMWQMPDLRGLFPRFWSNNSTRDPDRNSRLNRGDGTTGDQPGTIQLDEFKAHNHETDDGDSYYTDKPGTEFFATGPASDLRISKEVFTGTTGGAETRPINIYFNPIVKY